MGYGLLPTGALAVDLDAQARAVIPLVCAQCDTGGALSGLLHSLIRHHIWRPVRARTGPQKGQVPWRRPSLAPLRQVLHHPLSAGASA